MAAGSGPCANAGTGPDKMAAEAAENERARNRRRDGMGVSRKMGPFGRIRGRGGSPGYGGLVSALSRTRTPADPGPIRTAGRSCPCRSPRRATEKSDAEAVRKQAEREHDRLLVGAVA